MTETLIKKPKFKDIRSQRCYEAVMRTYREMSKDEPAYIALDAARRVYNFHFPEHTFCDTALIVESWVNGDKLQ